MIKAILFDMDGTLIDSESYYYKARLIASKEFGYENMEEYALGVRGLIPAEAEKYMKANMGEDFPWQTIRCRRREILQELYQEKPLQAKAGAKECLQKVKALGYKIAIATSSNYENASSQLQKVGLLEEFELDNVICAAEFKKSKPDPFVYLYACKQLGIEPEEAIAIEDAPNGILSAYRAGIPIILVPDLDEPDDQMKTMIKTRINSLSELPAVLTELEK